MANKAKENLNNKKISQFLTIVKEQIIDKKWSILILGAMIGGMALLIVAMIGDMDLEIFAEIEAYNEILEFMGGADISNPYGFLSMEVLTVIWMFVGIYMIFSASLIIPQEIDEKTIELFLSKPITRTKFLGAKILSNYMIITGILVIGFIMISGFLPLSPDFVEEGLYFDRLWATCIVEILFLGVMSMFSLFCSIIFLHSKKAMVLGIVVLFTMFFTNGFYSYVDELEFLQWFTIFRYFNTADYLLNPELVWYIRDIIVLASGNVVFVVGSLVVFNKKDIPN
jgi:ABC-type transport system involved in multi-copper enzyme maturation permease subunit